MARKGLLTVRVRLPLIALRRLRDEGHPEVARELAADLGVRSLDATAIEVTVDAYSRVCDRASAVLGDRFLGLNAAIALPRGHYGLFEFVLRSRATVRDALRAVGRFAPLVYPEIQVQVDDGEAAGHIEFRLRNAPNGVGRHGNEFALAAIVKLGREASGQRLVPESVELTNPRPGDVSELETFFGTPRLVFNSDANRVNVGQRTLDTSFRSADPALASVLETEAAAKLPATPSTAEALPGLRERMRKRLLDGEPVTLERMAAALHASPRTLQRRLGDAGVTFHQELDVVRRAIATSELRRGQLSTLEIALLTGYANQSGFERAFVRWTGKTPRQFADAGERS